MNILGISGYKQAGKDTLGNFLSGVKLKQNDMVEDFRITNSGELEIFTTYSDGSKDWGVLDVNRKDREFVEAAEETIWPYVKVYSFADPLKRLGIDLFGLSYESVYGTDEQKNAPTHLLWENMPGVVTPRKHQDLASQYNESSSDFVDHWGITIHEPGPMTGREFLQFFGTEIGRKIYAPIWINATMGRILAEGSELAIITDVRFPDEVEAIAEANGLVGRLTRKTHNDLHASETALDGYKKFSFLLDNQDMDISESCEAMLNILKQHNYF